MVILVDSGQYNQPPLAAAHPFNPFFNNKVFDRQVIPTDKTLKNCQGNTIYYMLVILYVQQCYTHHVIF